MTVSLLLFVHHDAGTNKKKKKRSFYPQGYRNAIPDCSITLDHNTPTPSLMLAGHFVSKHHTHKVKGWRTFMKYVYLRRNKQKKELKHTSFFEVERFERLLFCQLVWWLNCHFLHYFISWASSYFTCLHFFSATVSSNSPSIDRGVCIPPVRLANSPFCLFHPDRGGTMRWQKIKAERKNQ